MSDFYDRLRELAEEYDDARADEERRRERLEDHAPATRATGDRPNPPHELRPEVRR
jgi:hypothetical protein